METGSHHLDGRFQLPTTLGAERLDGPEQHFLERSILDCSRNILSVAV